MAPAQGTVQGKVLQPIGVTLPERLVLRSVMVRCTVDKTAIGATDESLPEPVCGVTGKLVQVLVGQPPLGDQQLGTDQRGITGVNGQALVGRQVRMGWSQRQGLPYRLPGGCQELNEPVGLGA